MNILIDIIPGQYRRPVYAVYAFVGLVLGAWAVVDTPAWLVSALAVYSFVGTALGLTAYANTNPEQVVDHEV